MYVTSRSFDLPSAAEEMDGSLWFNLWGRRLWPYEELKVGDDLWWYETPSQRIVWRTRVAQVEAFGYASLQEALDRVDAAFGDQIDRTQPYLQDRPEQGFCLAYRVEVVETADLPKPPGLRFSQQGWERADRPDIAAWLGHEGIRAENGDGARTAEGAQPSNPDWTRDEVILALDLFVKARSLGGGPLPGKADPRIVSLSDELARLPIHPPDQRGRDFRNPTGVALKLANLRAIDRDLAIERGDAGALQLPKGMARYSALDRSTFEEFYDAWDRLREEALAIRVEASPTEEAARRPTVKSRPIEESRTETFDAAPTSGGSRTRREAMLVQRYARWMAARGIKVESQEYGVPGEARPLVCDAFAPELSLLIEAKAQDNRNSVRLAIGQLMDYRRFVKDPRLAILLPHEPASDHQALLRSVGVAWIWPDHRGGFRDSTGGDLTGR